MVDRLRPRLRLVVDRPFRMVGRLRLLVCLMVGRPCLLVVLPCLEGRLRPVVCRPVGLPFLVVLHPVALPYPVVRRPVDPCLEAGRGGRTFPLL